MLILFVEDESCPEDKRHSKSFKGFHVRSSTAQSSVCGYLKQLTVLVRPFTNTLSYSLNHQALSSDKQWQVLCRQYWSISHLFRFPQSDFLFPIYPTQITLLTIFRFQKFPQVIFIIRTDLPRQTHQQQTTNTNTFFILVLWGIKKCFIPTLYSSWKRLRRPRLETNFLKPPNQTIRNNPKYPIFWRPRNCGFNPFLT